MKYIKDGFYKSDKEYLQFIISQGHCVGRKVGIACMDGCYICKVHRKEYGDGIKGYGALVEYCKELLKKEDIQLEFVF